jgi:hypothetical protein
MCFAAAICSGASRSEMGDFARAWRSRIFLANPGDGLGAKGSDAFFEIPHGSAIPPFTPAARPRTRIRRAQSLLPSGPRWGSRTAVHRARTCETLRSRRTDRFQAVSPPRKLRSKSRPAKDLASLAGSTQVTFAFTPASIISCARSPVGISQSGKQRFEASPLQLPDAVVANVLEKEVAECHRRDSFRHRALAHHAHAVFVLRVRARRRQLHRPQRQPRALRLVPPPARAGRHASPRGSPPS